MNKKVLKKSLTLFNPKLPKLTRNEMRVLDLLIEAGKLIAPLYEEQENDNYLGSNFYPHSATKDEIEKGARLNPDLLSPYTTVEKQNGELVAIPYHQKYAHLLKPVADKLMEASSATDNREFSKRLKIQAKALLDGSYDQATISWMSMKPYVLDINIGPVERYDDRLFFTKTSYQAWVGVMDKENTRRVIAYKDLILSSRRKALMPSERVDYFDKIQCRVDDVLLFSGQIARQKFIGVNLPNDIRLLEKYGSELTMFKQPNEVRMRREILPVFERIFSAEFKKTFSRSDLEAGSLDFNVLHELAHVYLRYRHAEEKLKDLFPYIDELAAYVVGIKVCGSLLLKDIITQHQLESIMVAFIAKSFYMVLEAKDDYSRVHYTIGHAIFLNYLLDNGAIKEAGGISWLNFTKMFFAIGELASVLEKILSSGEREDAAKFIKLYGDLRSLQKFKGHPLN